MNTSNTTETRSCSHSRAMFGRGLGRYVPAWLGGSRGIILAAIAVIAGGTFLGWPWLVSIGAASVVLSLLPCLLMCALGLCMMGRGRQSQAQQPEVVAAVPALLARDTEARHSVQPPDGVDGNRVQLLAAPEIGREFVQESSSVARHW